MSSFMCPAGHLISLKAMPNPHTLRIYGQGEFYAAMDRIDDVLEGKTVRPGSSMWVYDALAPDEGVGLAALQCPECHRILILDRQSNLIGSFVPETGQVGNTTLQRPLDVVTEGRRPGSTATS